MTHTDCVSLKYFVKVLRELVQDGQLKAVKLMLEDARITDKRVYWERGSL